MSLLEMFRAKIEDFRRIIQPGWGIEDIPVDSVNPVHVVNNIWQRTLSFISGWDYLNNVRRKIAVDPFGRVMVTGGVTGGAIPNVSQVIVTVGVTLMIGVDTSRTYLLLHNQGNFVMYFSHSNAVSASNGYRLDVQETVKLDNWTSELYGIAVTGATVVGMAVR